ncbi:MAG: hypothetical protein BWY39_01785 [Spirochaetes bacterium ADurb.Bin269]|nr:MAG: hypothetical protein BWY39_01785 [Spirochaetes bacterium ADurb.Bin269]
MLDHDVVVVDFYFSLIGEAVQLVLHLVHRQTSPARYVLDRGLERAEIGRAVRSRLGFLQHQEYVGYAGHLVRNGKDHKPPLLGEYALYERL